MNGANDKYRNKLRRPLGLPTYKYSLKTHKEKSNANTMTKTKNIKETNKHKGTNQRMKRKQKGNDGKPK